MDINPKILKKIKELTTADSTLGEFLFELLTFEAGGSGWYRDQYNNLIDKYAMGRKQDADKEH